MEKKQKIENSGGGILYTVQKLMVGHELLAALSVAGRSASGWCSGGGGTKGRSLAHLAGRPSPTIACCRASWWARPRPCCRAGDDCRVSLLSAMAISWTLLASSSCWGRSRRHGVNLPRAARISLRAAASPSSNNA